MYLRETTRHLNQDSRHRNFMYGGCPPYTKQEFLPLARWNSEIYSRLESGNYKMGVYKRVRATCGCSAMINFY
jgi:hypothetical protein